MKRIVKPNKDDVISIDKLTHQSKIGIQLGSEKYLVVSKRNDSGDIVYTRMNDNGYILGEGYQSMRSLVEFHTMGEAFLFSDLKEAFKWLME